MDRIRGTTPVSTDKSVPFSVLSGGGGGELGSQRIERFGARRRYPIPRGGERGHYRGGSENAAVVGEEGSESGAALA